MAYDIIEVDVTINGTAYSAGDVLFELTEVPLPARACKLIHGFFEVQSSGQAAAESFNCMFFKSNVGGNLASVVTTATPDFDAVTSAKLILHVEY